MKSVDVVIIGGGINGCGCAADAASRGLSVLLCEQDDLASKTSSSSSNLIHGGLRYLEHFDFHLVKTALAERQRLLTLAPHLVRPLAFCLPHTMRNRWVLKAGLFLYDHLSQENTLPHHQSLTRAQQNTYFRPLHASIQDGFLYYDCQTNDARLTLANALQAAQHGATIMTRTQLTHATVVNHAWQLTLKPQQGQAFTVQARVVINAAGPWVKSVHHLLKPDDDTLAVTLIQGSHLIIPKLYTGEFAYLLQTLDNRVVFTIPYHGNTLVGTTETPLSQATYPAHIAPHEIDYLLNTLKRYFKKTIHPSDIIHTTTGIRTLVFASHKNPSALSRDYAYHLTQQPCNLLTILSGKLTTYRELAEQAIDALRPLFPNLKPSMTREKPLPGATLNNGEITFDQYKTSIQKRYPWLNKDIQQHYIQTYGTRMACLLHGKESIDDLGLAFGDVLYQAEVDYLMQHEWAQTVEDIVWRRTKLGLILQPNQLATLACYMSDKKTDTHTTQPFSASNC